MIGWLECGSGASGDMLLGALVDAGVPLEVLAEAVHAVAPEPVTLRARRVVRASLAATKVDVEAAPSPPHRTWRDLRAILDAAPRLPGAEQARRTFRLLVEAEAGVHGISPDEVHLHEVGALDAIADIVGVCGGFAHLGLDSLVVSPVALGGGSVRAAHGRLAVPGPAVVSLLAGAPTYGGPVDVELTTPTGAALLAAHATGWGPAPLMTGSRQGFGAGGRDLPGVPNVLRLVIGERWSPGDHSTAGSGPRTGPDAVAVLTELSALVDDLDPRVWPAALDALLAAGAIEAWLSPVLMRKGRPGHCVHALAGPGQADAVATAMLTHTSTLGVRRHAVQRQALQRRTVTTDLDGHPIRVKLGLLDGAVLHANPEWDDVHAAAAALARPARSVLQQAQALAVRLLTEDAP